MKTVKIGFNRQKIGHFTCSALILNSANEFLLLHHKKYNKWTMPGGHCDSNTDLLDCMKKEVFEEAGISEDDMFFIADEVVFRKQLDADGDHYDFCFKVIVKDNINVVINHESTAFKWHKITDNLSHLCPHVQEVVKEFK